MQRIASVFSIAAALFVFAAPLSPPAVTAADDDAAATPETRSEPESVCSQFQCSISCAPYNGVCKLGQCYCF